MRVRVLAGIVAVSLLGACADAPLPTAPQSPGDDASRSDVRTGYVPGRDGRPVQVTFAVRNGLAVLDGDIVLGRASEIARSPEELAGRPRAAGGPNFGVAIDNSGSPGYRWVDARAPRQGTVYYEIDPAFGDPSLITDGIALVERTNPGVFLYPRSGQADYLYFVAETGVCQSYIGRQGGKQPIWANCWTPGVVAHEILHALGMDHEQNRCDRDDYIEVVWENIDPAYRFAYEKKCSFYTDYGPYEEGSVMHYGPFDWGLPGAGPTMLSRRGKSLGQRDSLATTDAATLRALYAPGGVPACKPAYPGGPCVEAGAVTGFALFDQDTKRPIPGYETLVDGATVDRTRLPTQRVEVRAVTSPAQVGSVRFEMTTQGTHTDNVAPYAHLGDSRSYWWTPTPGQYTVTATPYSLGAAGGTRGRARTVRFTVVDGPATVRPTLLAARDLGANLCLDIWGASAEPGSPAAIHPCHGGANQQVTFTAAGEARVYGTLCLDAWGAEGNDGDRVVLWHCNGGANQRWRATAEGQVVGINGKCLDVPSYNTTPGTQLIIWTCHGGPNQRWERRDVVQTVARAAAR